MKTREDVVARVLEFLEQERAEPSDPKDKFPEITADHWFREDNMTLGIQIDPDTCLYIATLITSGRYLASNVTLYCVTHKDAIFLCRDTTSLQAVLDDRQGQALQSRWVTRGPDGILPLPDTEYGCRMLFFVPKEGAYFLGRYLPPTGDYPEPAFHGTPSYKDTCRTMFQEDVAAWLAIPDYQDIKDVFGIEEDINFPDISKLIEIGKQVYGEDWEEK